MKGFYTIFQASVLIILILNPILVVLLGDNFLAIETNTKLITMVVFILIEFIIILSLVKNYFHDPIIKLEHTIKNFLV